MPGNTARILLPYALGTDPVAEGDLAIKALADAVDLTLAGAKSRVGIVSTTTSAAGQVVVTHGMGATPVNVNVNSVGTGGSAHFCAVTAMTSTQFTVTVRNVTAAGATVNSTAVVLQWFGASA